MIELSVLVIELQATYQSPSIKNEFLNIKLSEVSRVNSKGKTEKSQIQLELEYKLSKANEYLTASLERSTEPERDMVKPKAGLKKAFNGPLHLKYLQVLLLRGQAVKDGWDSTVFILPTILLANMFHSRTICCVSTIGKIVTQGSHVLL